MQTAVAFVVFDIKQAVTLVAVMFLAKFSSPNFKPLSINYIFHAISALNFALLVRILFLLLFKTRSIKILTFIGDENCLFFI